MSGSPIRRARQEIAEKAIFIAAAKEQAVRRKVFTADVDAAILRAYAERADPVELMLPVAEALHAAAIGGDVVAIREVLDRVSGKVEQGVVLPGGEMVPGITITILTTGGQDALSPPQSAMLPELPLEAIEGEFSNAETVTKERVE